MFTKREQKEQEEIRRREEAYARKKDLEELERRVSKVEARVRVLQAVANLAEEENGELTNGQ